MNETTTTVDYLIETLQDKHLRSAVDLFTRNFCESEPITKHLSIHYQDYLPFATEVIQKAIKDGLSKVAVDKQNRVIAATIAEDMADPFLPKLTHYPKMKPIFALLDELSKPFLENKIFSKGKILHVWVTIVDATHRGQGLSTQMDMTCGSFAARKGYDFAYAEFTNPISEKIIHQYSVNKCFNRINYSDFNFEGQKPFAGVPGGAAAYVVTLRPGVNIASLQNSYTLNNR